MKKKRYTKEDIEKIYGKNFFTKDGEECTNTGLVKEKCGCVCCNPEAAIEYMNEYGEIPENCFC